MQLYRRGGGTCHVTFVCRHILLRIVVIHSERCVCTGRPQALEIVGESRGMQLGIHTLRI